MSNSFTPTARIRLTPEALAAALAELSTKLTEINSTVQTLCQSGLEVAISPNDLTDDPLGNQQGETRHYYFSPLTLKHERALLERYNAHDWRELICEAHSAISGLADLMKNLEQESKFDSSTAFSLGCLLEHQADMLFRIQDAYSGLERLEA